MACFGLTVNVALSVARSLSSNPRRGHAREGDPHQMVAAESLRAAAGRPAELGEFVMGPAGYQVSLAAA
jgi:hypothetical protein